MAIWREEQSPWDVMFPLHPDKNEKDKIQNISLKKSETYLTFISD